jgi:hypothetical protein
MLTPEVLQGVMSAHQESQVGLGENKNIINALQVGALIEA